MTSAVSRRRGARDDPPGGDRPAGPPRGSCPATGSDASVLAWRTRLSKACGRRLVGAARRPRSSRDPGRTCWRAGRDSRPGVHARAGRSSSIHCWAARSWRTTSISSSLSPCGEPADPLLVRGESQQRLLVVGRRPTRAPAPDQDSTAADMSVRSWKTSWLAAAAGWQVVGEAVDGGGRQHARRSPRSTAISAAIAASAHDDRLRPAARPDALQPMTLAHAALPRAPIPGCGRGTAPAGRTARVADRASTRGSAWTPAPSDSARQTERVSSACTREASSRGLNGLVM